MKALLLAAVLALPSAFADPETDVQQVLKRDFHGRGQATMDRIDQDGLQRICTRTHDRPPEALARALEADQQNTIMYPAGGLMGDWKRGERLAQSGQGMTWNDKPGNAGGSCYNCHELSPHELSFGTIGPSLRGFGKKRGDGPDVQRYVYAKIYNAKAFAACSQMPRFGTSGTLDAEQIKDLVALLLDPSSPVNQ
jgi:L-cysteine S-thiosulfotransferase